MSPELGASLIPRPATKLGKLFAAAYPSRYTSFAEVPPSASGVEAAPAVLATATSRPVTRKEGRKEGREEGRNVS
jgi:hypothetical protein